MEKIKNADGTTEIHFPGTLEEVEAQIDLLPPDEAEPFRRGLRQVKAMIEADRREPDLLADFQGEA